jgi:hypothetical protein
VRRRLLAALALAPQALQALPGRGLRRRLALPSAARAPCRGRSLRLLATPPVVKVALSLVIGLVVEAAVGTTAAAVAAKSALCTAYQVAAARLGTAALRCLHRTPLVVQLAVAPRAAQLRLLVRTDSSFCRALHTYRHRRRVRHRLSRRRCLALNR